MPWSSSCRCDPVCVVFASRVEAASNKGIATSNKGITSSSNKGIASRLEAIVQWKSVMFASRDEAAHGGASCADAL